MAELRRALENKNILDVFDRVVFDNIIEKVIVGSFSENGKADPYKLTFVMKGNETGIIPDAKMHFKEINKAVEKGVINA